MAVSRYTATLKRRTNVISNITPSPFLQKNADNPAGTWKPAAWLPIEWTDTVTQDSFVISTGKVIALCGEDERIVPAGYYLRTTIGSTFVTYTTADVTAGVIDIVTGVTLTATGTRTAQAVATALLARGLVNEADLALGHDFYSGISDQSDVTAVIEAFISLPVGIVKGDVYVWAGDFPNYNYANYCKQHLIQFVTEWQMVVPHLANTTAATTGDLEAAAAWSSVADGTQMPDADVAGAELYVTPAQLAGLTRYSGVIAATDNLAGYSIRNIPGCKNTSRTPLSFATSEIFGVNEKTSIASVTTAGDYFWDAEVGMLIVSASAGAQVATAGVTTMTYYYYSGGSAAAARMIHLCGEARRGQFLTVDSNSNFVAIDITPGTTNMGGIVGRIYRLISQPRGLLERVETAWSASNMTAVDQMPGTATAGYTDLITLSPETVADQLAILNIKIS